MSQEKKYMITEEQRINVINALLETPAKFSHNALLILGSLQEVNVVPEKKNDPIQKLGKKLRK